MSSEVIEAAAELRAAVHALAMRTTTTELDAAALRRAAAGVQAVTADLDGPELAPWWDGPRDRSREGLRSYRRRSVFQGVLHPFSNQIDWFDASGPEGEPGYGFEVSLSPLHQGPPLTVHGGYLAGLFDELFGAVQGLAVGPGGVTGRLTVRYRAMTPVDSRLRFVGWVQREAGRRIETHATCMAGEVLCAEADGLFVRPSRVAAP